MEPTKKSGIASSLAASLHPQKSLKRCSRKLALLASFAFASTIVASPSSGLEWCCGGARKETKQPLLKEQQDKPPVSSVAIPGNNFGDKNKENTPPRQKSSHQPMTASGNPISPQDLRRQKHREEKKRLKEEEKKLTEQLEQIKRRQKEVEALEKSQPQVVGHNIDTPSVSSAQEALSSPLPSESHNVGSQPDPDQGLWSTHQEKVVKAGIAKRNLSDDVWEYLESTENQDFSKALAGAIIDSQQKKLFEPSDDVIDIGHLFTSSFTLRSGEQESTFYTY